jgi:zinc D-Ala-D-Ala carboxypeptidase
MQTPNAALSKHLSYSQVTSSSTAARFKIENTPSNKELQSLTLVGGHIYDPICEEFGKVFVSSGYRHPRVNALVGGSSTSSHCKGEALDLDGDAPNVSYQKVSNSELFKFILDNLEFDQLIAEFEENGQPRWVHVSYREGNNRMQALIASRVQYGKTRYIPYSEEMFAMIYEKGRVADWAAPRSLKLPEYILMEEEDCPNELALDEEYAGNHRLQDYALLDIISESPVLNGNAPVSESVAGEDPTYPSDCHNPVTEINAPDGNWVKVQPVQVQVGAVRVRVEVEVQAP